MNFGKSGNSPNYYRKFGLDVDPFPVDTFDNILFLSPDLKKRIDTVKDLVINSEKLVLVTSRSGGGKSILADYLKSIPEENWTIALVQAFDGMDRESLAYEIIQKVSPDSGDDKSFAIPQLHKLLEVCAKSGKTPVLIIDDSHHLPIETLIFILELIAVKYGDTTFRFVLFANEDIAKQFKDERLAEFGKEMVSHINLPPMNREQVKEYIDTRLRSAGDIEDYPFDEGDIQDIFKVSSGVPKDINIVARELMQAKPGTHAGKIQQYRTFILAGVLTVLCVVVYFMLFQDEASVPQATPPQTVASANTVQSNTDTAVTAQAPETTASTAATQIQNNPENIAYENGPSLTPDEIPEEVLQEYEEQTSLNEEEIREIEEAYNREINEAVEIALSSGSSTPVETYEAETIEAETYEVVTTEPETFETDTFETETVEPVASEPQTVEVEEEEPVVVSSTAPVSTTEPPQTVSSIETTTAIPREPVRPRTSSTSRSFDPDNIFKLNSVPGLLDGIKGENWYRQQDRSAYVLQLISASDLDNVIELLEGMPGVQDELSGYVRYTPSGQPRYLLFYGIYRDRDAAIAATANIPARYRALNPYPRIVDNIIDEIEVLGYWPR